MGRVLDPLLCVLLAGIQSVGIGAYMHVCVWYTELTCISNGVSKADTVVGKVLFVCVCVSACMLVCVWYTEPTCIPYWASRTDVVGQCVDRWRGHSRCRAPLTTGVDIYPRVLPSAYCVLGAGLSHCRAPLTTGVEFYHRVLPYKITIN